MLIIHRDKGLRPPWDLQVYRNSVHRDRLVSPGLQNYTLGRMQPNYPVPATMDNAVIALFNQPEIVLWSIEWAKRNLRR